jgi:2-C-methyl-D-erythritol 2,4-cyclodiphosphate synthase
MTEKEIAELVARQRLAFASDFHALSPGSPLILGGVTIPFPKGFTTGRSDGDVVAHAIVMALAAATGTGDIDDWFPGPEREGERARSIDYLAEIYARLIAPRQILIHTIDVTIVCGEQPRLKQHLPDMQRNIAERLRIPLSRVQLKVSSKDGEDEIAQLKGIEAHVLVSLFLGNVYAAS